MRKAPYIVNSDVTWSCRSMKKERKKTERKKENRNVKACQQIYKN